MKEQLNPHRQGAELKKLAANIANPPMPIRAGEMIVGSVLLFQHDWSAIALGGVLFLHGVVGPAIVESLKPDSKKPEPK